MNKIEVCLTPKLFDLYTTKNKIIVIVDILRATTMITSLFKNGLEKLIPVKSLDEAKEYKARGYLVAAERDGKKVDFADFGNSPFEFTKERIENKTLVYSSTNGTRTINLPKEGEQIIVASFLNLSRVVNHLSQQTKDVLILCSGWMDDFCTEDFIFAGAISEKLVNSNRFEFDTDQVQLAIDTWSIAKLDLQEYIKKMHQYKRLNRFGFKEIVDYCFRLDISDKLPIVKQGSIVDFDTIERA